MAERRSRRPGGWDGGNETGRSAPQSIREECWRTVTITLIGDGYAVATFLGMPLDESLWDQLVDDGRTLREMPGDAVGWVNRHAPSWKANGSPRYGCEYRPGHCHVLLSDGTRTLVAPPVFMQPDTAALPDEDAGDGPVPQIVLGVRP